MMTLILTSEGGAAEASVQLRHLSRPECIHLLNSSRLGRVSAIYEGWPAIWSVNYSFRDDSVLIRSGCGRKLAQATMNAVAFQTDRADENGLWGWSVMVQGPAFDITHATDPRRAALRDTEIESWAPGSKDHCLQIEALWITGKAFGPCPGLI